MSFAIEGNYPLTASEGVMMDTAKMGYTRVTFYEGVFYNNKQAYPSGGELLLLLLRGGKLSRATYASPTIHGNSMYPILDYHYSNTLV